MNAGELIARIANGSSGYVLDTASRTGEGSDLVCVRRDRCESGATIYTACNHVFPDATIRVFDIPESEGDEADSVLLKLKVFNFARRVIGTISRRSVAGRLLAQQKPGKRLARLADELVDQFRSAYTTLVDDWFDAYDSAGEEVALSLRAGTFGTDHARLVAAARKRARPIRIRVLPGGLVSAADARGLDFTDDDDFVQQPQQPSDDPIASDTGLSSTAPSSMAIARGDVASGGEGRVVHPMTVLVCGALDERPASSSGEAVDLSDVFMQRMIQRLLLVFGLKKLPPYISTNNKGRSAKTRLPILVTNEEYAQLRGSSLYWGPGGYLEAGQITDPSFRSVADIRFRYIRTVTAAAAKDSVPVLTRDWAQRPENGLVKALRIAPPGKDPMWAIWKPAEVRRYAALKALPAFGEDLVDAYVAKYISPELKYTKFFAYPVVSASKRARRNGLGLPIMTIEAKARIVVERRIVDLPQSADVEAETGEEEEEDEETEQSPPRLVEVRNYVRNVRDRGNRKRYALYEAEPAIMSLFTHKEPSSRLVTITPENPLDIFDVAALGMALRTGRIGDRKTFGVQRADALAEDVVSRLRRDDFRTFKSGLLVGQYRERKGCRDILPFQSYLEHLLTGDARGAGESRVRRPEDFVEAIARATGLAVIVVDVDAGRPSMRILCQGMWGGLAGASEVVVVERERSTGHMSVVARKTGTKGQLTVQAVMKRLGAGHAWAYQSDADPPWGRFDASVHIRRCAPAESPSSCDHHTTAGRDVRAWLEPPSLSALRSSPRVSVRYQVASNEGYCVGVLAAVATRVRGAVVQFDMHETPETILAHSGVRYFRSLRLGPRLYSCVAVMQRPHTEDSLAFDAHRVRIVDSVVLRDTLHDDGVVLDYDVWVNRVGVRKADAAFAEAGDLSGDTPELEALRHLVDDDSSFDVEDIEYGTPPDGDDDGLRVHAGDMSTEMLHLPTRGSLPDHSLPMVEQRGRKFVGMTPYHDHSIPALLSCGAARTAIRELAKDFPAFSVRYSFTRKGDDTGFLLLASGDFAVTGSRCEGSDDGDDGYVRARLARLYASVTDKSEESGRSNTPLSLRCVREQGGSLIVGGFFNRAPAYTHAHIPGTNQIHPLECEVPMTRRMGETKGGHALYFARARPPPRREVQEGATPGALARPAVEPVNYDALRALLPAPEAWYAQTGVL